MFCSIRYSFRPVNKLIDVQKYRWISQCATQKVIGENGHYDMIIVGGGATGISLAGAIGK